jgi:hypothetical protein
VIAALPVLKDTGFGDVAAILGKTELKSPAQEFSFLGNRIERWLVEPRSMPISASGKTLVDIVSGKFQLIMGSGLRRTVEGKSFDDFLAERLWMRAGATSWKDQVPAGYNMNKAAVGLNHTPAELRSRFERDMDNGSAHWEIIPKREPVAPRAVCKVDDSMYLFFSWVMYYVFPWIEDSPYLYQTQSADAKFKFWRRCQWYIGKADAVDLDFKNFDESHTKALVMQNYDDVVDLACTLGGNKHHMREMWNQRVRPYINNAHITSNDVTTEGKPTKRQFQWNNGGPSGDLLTWLRNAIVNIALAMERSDYLYAVGSGPESAGFHILTSQGDDLHEIPVGRITSLEPMVAWYADLGYVVHPTKSKISRSTGGEFLKMEITKNSVAGTKWRLMRSILWGQVELGEGDFSSVKAKLSERVSLWLMAEQRGLIASREDVEHDLFGAAARRVAKATITLALETSTAMGGFGFYDQKTDREIRWESEKPEILPIYIRLKPSSAFAYERAWRRGMVTLLRGARKKSDVTSKSARVLIDNLSVSKVPRNRAYAMYTSRVHDHLPLLPKLGRWFGSRYNGQKHWDSEVTLSAIRRNDKHPEPQLDVSLSRWRSITSNAMWPEVLKARGYPVPGMSPKFARYFGEQLSALAWGAFSKYVVSILTFNKINALTFRSASILVCDILPGTGITLATM